MFEAFSRGYYLGRLYVEPHDGDHAVMQRAQHDQVNAHLYAGAGADDADGDPGADDSTQAQGLSAGNLGSDIHPEDARSRDAAPAGDPPLVMKLEGLHFPVGASGDVPNGTLGLPHALLESCGIENPPALEEVLLARADRARQLLRWFGRSGWPGRT